MKTLKILFVPVLIVGALLLILYTTNVFPYFYQNTDIWNIIYRFLFPAKQVIYPFDAGRIYDMLTSLFFIFILIIMYVFIKDKYIRIGIKITIILFVVFFFIGLVLLLFSK
ncbi:MAG: hypothetical protein PHC83_00935 [Bacteroidales bacterium]|nr:hypothetical protein [Bacteroidales bacterium]MDD4209336.1 hypothetical protein [Bacteroidales bacterium]